MTKTQSTILTIACLMTFFVSSAAPVTRSEALNSAKEFFSLRGENGIAERLEINEKISRTCSDNIQKPVHIFNIGEDKGFIIIAGDDRARTVLAYSTEGCFDTSDLPEACAAWLQTYSDEIESLQSAETDFLTAISSGFSYPDVIVQPILKSKWDQEYPYNANCPTDNVSGRKCLTGCVATATAQIMNHHRYPYRGTGLIMYEDKTQNTHRLLDFSNQGDIKWDDIIHDYSGNYTETQKEAIANLMMQVGHACKMQYSSVTSIAIHRDAAEALVNNFGYDRNIHRYERKFMDEASWVGILTGELAAGRPILYDGRSENSGGHSFVCDGYDGNGKFHFNWGWSGMADGYYSLSALNPITQGIYHHDYTGSQAIECRIMPPGSEDSVLQTDWLLGIDNLYVLTDAYTKYADIESPLSGRAGESGFFFYCWNIGHNTFEGEICATTLINGTITPISTVQAGITPNSYKGQTLTIPANNVPDGTYKVSFHYRLPDSDKWHPIRSVDGLPHEALITVAGDNISYGDGSSSSIDRPTMDSDIEISYGHRTIDIKSAYRLSSVRLTDLSGRLRYSAPTLGEAVTITTEGLSHGLYILEVKTEGGITQVKKIVI